ncbi:GNAT family N-acetyltransferase [Candidatus Saccharibacteria bacterium]|nr:GNAT family N-acetyltransferase [Candidatus Saccharibacteria bacterium]
MNVTIRRAEESDIRTIQEFGSKLLNFERENYDPSLNEDWAFSDEARAKYLDAIHNRYVVIAEIDGRAVGFLIGNIIKSENGNARNIKQANLQNIFVDKSHRNAGIGEKLVNDFFVHCRNEKVNRINVSVLAANKNAVGFYNKVGFAPRSINLSMDF